MTDRISILHPQGRLDGATGPAFDNDVAQLIAGGADKVLLDLAELQYISSAGLRAVLLAAKRLKSVGGQLVLCSLNDQVREIFEVSGFTRFLDISPSQDEAMSRMAT